jgi:diguanylate cyclase (GGDEF)-like protein
MLAVLWLFRWPSRMQSIVFSLASSACITSACLVQSEPRAGLLGCTAFAVLGGYIAFFHTAPYMAANFVVAGGAAAVLAVRLIPSYDGVLATCAWLLIMLLNVAFPLAAQSLVQMLGSDLRRSSRDALTGLLSRRAFYQAANNLLIHSRTRRSSFGVAIIDLDNFKRINDTRGHLVGDQALAEVGAVLRLNCPSSSVIGRIGGEEFVVADTLASPDLYGMAERSREAIATLGFSITASIGIAVAAMGPAFEPSERQVIERLIRSADAAMYEAKRAGGNRVWMAESEPHWHGHGTNPHGPPNELAGQNATESGHRPERPSRTEASWERS